MRRFLPATLRRHLHALRTLASGSRWAYLRLLMRRPAPDRLPPRGPLRSVLFVCHGNVMRSAFAAELWNSRFAQHARNPATEALSCGMHTRPGRPADPKAVEAAAARGVSLHHHLSTPVSAALVHASELIFAMDLLNTADLLARFPEARDRIYLLGALGGERPVEIEDPYGKEMPDVERCFERVEACVTALAEHLATPAHRE